MHFILTISNDQELITQICQYVEGLGEKSVSIEGQTLLEEPEDLSEVSIALIDTSIDTPIGRDLLAFLKNSKSYQHIELIMLVDDATYYNNSLLVDYLESGAGDYIRKPVRQAIFMARIKKALEKQKYIREISLNNINFAQQQVEIYKQKEEIKTQREIAQQAVANHKASLNYALRIQTIMLPDKDFLSNVLPKHFVFFKPRDIVSGDFYWVAEKDEKLIIVAADCTGHGVPGAFMSLIGFNLLSEIVNVKQIDDSDELLNTLHIGIKTTLRQETTSNRDGMDIAVCIVDRHYLTMDFSAAKNPICFVQHHRKEEPPLELSMIKGDILPVGGVQIEDNRQFTKHLILLAKNLVVADSMFYLYSDGYQDQFGGDKERKFGVKRLKELLFEIHQKPMEEQGAILNSTIEAWMVESKQNQLDDIMVFGFRIDEEVVAYWQNKKPLQRPSDFKIFDTLDWLQ